MKILACGDFHMGAGADLGLKPGDRLAEQERVWRWCLEQAREHAVDALLFAGDAFQHRKPDPETMLAFERPLVDHIEDFGGPKPLVIVGNHDISSLDGACALDVFEEAGLIDLVREPRVVSVGGARVVCLPWAPTSRLAANYDGPRDLLNQHAAALLIEIARGLHDGPATGSLSASPIILLTHFSISGTSLPSGLDVGQLREPVLPQEDLLAIGYDAIVAGHIHRPALFGFCGLYVGSPMPLNFGENDGCERGPWLVTLGGQSLAGLTLGGTSSSSRQQLPAPSRRFVNLDVGPPHLCVYDTADITDAYVKVRVRGTEREVAAADIPRIKAGLEADGAYRVFVETQVERETRARDGSVDDSLDEREALRRWMDSQDLDPELAAAAFDRAVGYLDRAAGGSVAPVAEPLVGAAA